MGLVVVVTGDKSGGSATPDCSEAHVQSQSGSFSGLELDCRTGTPPPEVQLGDVAAAAKAAGCELRENLPDEGANHVADSEKVVYKTNPPTSGNHNPTPTADGAYRTPLNTDTSSSPNVRNFVHSMEHGRIEIQYSSDLPESDQLALKGVFDESPDGMLMYPNDDMPYQVAATAWTNMLVCPKYDPAVLDAIRDFRDSDRGHGPEAGIPISL